jgi:hypothetical protein
MNKYAIKHESNTSIGSAIVIAAGLIGSLILQPDMGQGSQCEVSLLSRSPVKIEESSKTYGHYTNQFTGEYDNPSFMFEEKVTSLYAQLLQLQEPLGKEFEQVLYDNLWDLLVHT